VCAAGAPPPLRRIEKMSQKNTHFPKISQPRILRGYEDFAVTQTSY
jgi:hypothetical protein